MLFDQRMKEIEDDIPPFGIIDDGSEFITQVEHRETDPREQWEVPYEPDLW